jgi:hypothetical protein
MAVTYRRIPSTDPRLARHVRHDDRSKSFAFDTSGLSIVSAKHTRRIPVLDQGQLGSCTGNAGISCLGTEPFFSDLAGADGVHRAFSRRARVGTTYSLDEGGAVRLYSDATRADDYPGQYPPTDTGSDGLTIAKVLKSAGEIAGYQHTFTLDDALKALTVTPVICGITWYDFMFYPDPDGAVHPTGAVAGGHEICADQIDAERERVWFTNSWGPLWGVGGRFYLSFDNFGKLLADSGDVTIFTPLTQPAPTPTPPAPVPTPGDPDAAFAAVLRHHDWVHLPHVADNARVAAAGRAWLRAKGL